MRIPVVLAILIGAAPAGADSKSDLNTCRTGKPAAAAPACTRLLDAGKLSDRERASILNRRANAHGDLTRYELAFRDYAEAIRLNPKSSHAFNNRGLTYAERKRYPLAIRDYTEAVRLNPKDADFRDTRGQIFEALGRRAEAVRDYRTALKLDPSRADSRRRLLKLGATP